MSNFDNMDLKRAQFLLISGFSAVVLVACSAGSNTVAQQQTPAASSLESSVGSTAADGNNPATDVVDAAGPHAEKNHVADPPKILGGADGVRSVRFDLGVVSERSSVSATDGQDAEFTAPVRGVLTVPDSKNAPLIVINHLRAPNCSDQTFEFPCPNGTDALRFDEGMAYLGTALAKKGYATLIPDLSAAWVGSDVVKPYDQRHMWKQTIQMMTDAIKADGTGRASNFGGAIRHPIDTNRIGIFAHSRSGEIVNSTVELFGVDAIKGVFTYAPSYETIDDKAFSPAPADVPYLALASETDSDVGTSANLWAGKYLEEPRKSPLLVATTTGLGHFYANRALSSIGLDDRKSCEFEPCADAREHERVLVDAASQWFDTVLGESKPDVPIDAQGSLPSTIAGGIKVSPPQSLGSDLRWLAVTPESRKRAVTRLLPKDFHATDANSLSSQAAESGLKQPVEVCQHADLMDPSQKISAPCPEPDTGVNMVATDVALISGNASAEVATENAKHVAIHLMPFGSSREHKPTTVTIKFTLADGREMPLTLDSNNPALSDRTTDSNNGQYLLSTIRMALPPEAANTSIKKVTVEAPGRPVEVRGIDLY